MLQAALIFTENHWISRQKSNESLFWTTVMVTFCRRKRLVSHILTNPRSCRCKITSQTRIWTFWSIWRPVEPGFGFYSFISPKFLFFPLFLAPVEISAWFFQKCWDLIIFHLQMRGFGKILFSGVAVTPQTNFLHMQMEEIFRKKTERSFKIQRFYQFSAHFECFLKLGCDMSLCNKIIQKKVYRYHQLI